MQNGRSVRWCLSCVTLGDLWWNSTPSLQCPLCIQSFSSTSAATVYNATLTETFGAFLQIIAILFSAHKCIIYKIIVKIF